MACLRGKGCTRYHLNRTSNGFHGSRHNTPPSWRKQQPLLSVISHFPTPNQTDASLCIEFSAKNILLLNYTHLLEITQSVTAQVSLEYWQNLPRMSTDRAINTWTQWKMLFFYWSMSSQPSGEILQDRVCVFQGNGEDRFDVDIAWRRHELVKRFKTPVKYVLLKSFAVAMPSALILHSYQLPSWQFLITFFCFIYLIYGPSTNLLGVQ